MLTHGILPAFCDGVHMYHPPPSSQSRIFGSGALHEETPTGTVLCPELLKDAPSGGNRFTCRLNVCLPIITASAVTFTIHRAAARSYKKVDIVSVERL